MLIFVGITWIYPLSQSLCWSWVVFPFLRCIHGALSPGYNLSPGVCAGPGMFFPNYAVFKELSVLDTYWIYLLSQGPCWSRVVTPYLCCPHRPHRPGNLDIPSLPETVLVPGCFSLFMLSSRSLSPGYILNIIIEMQYRIQT